MKFFVDTTDIKEIKDLAATGMVDGVTTNPSLAAKSGKKFVDLIAEICAICPGPVSAEVTALDHETMMKEAAVLKKKQTLAEQADTLCAPATRTVILTLLTLYL